MRIKGIRGKLEEERRDLLETFDLEKLKKGKPERKVGFQARKP